MYPRIVSLARTLQRVQHNPRPITYIRLQSYNHLIPYRLVTFNYEVLIMHHKITDISVDVRAVEGSSQPAVTAT